MSIIPQLAHSLGRRDEIPNQDLAKTIVEGNNKAAVRELVGGLQHKTKDIQHDCVKVLYEVGRIKPSMVAAYLPEFIALLKSPNNRMQWGAMCAIDSLAERSAENVYHSLPQIIDAADKGSVITRDHAVFILVKLCAVPRFFDDAFELLVAQLRICPAKQLPMYAERAEPLVSRANREPFVEILKIRKPEMDTAAKSKRVEQIIKRLAVG